MTAFNQHLQKYYVDCAFQLLTYDKKSWNFLVIYLVIWNQNYFDNAFNQNKSNCTAVK